MSTFMANKDKIERKWYILDAAGKPLGKTAAMAASILRGKIRPEFTPNVDCGEFVIIINCGQAVLTGRKLDQKLYRHHTPYIGHLKSVRYRTLMEQKPDFAMMLAVKRMLPNTVIGRTSLTRLKLYRDDKYEQQAQKPVAYQF